MHFHSLQTPIHIPVGSWYVVHCSRLRVLASGRGLFSGQVDSLNATLDDIPELHDPAGCVACEGCGMVLTRMVSAGVQGILHPILLKSRRVILHAGILIPVAAFTLLRPRSMPPPPWQLLRWQPWPTLPATQLRVRVPTACCALN